MVGAKCVNACGLPRLGGKKYSRPMEKGIGQVPKPLMSSSAAHLGRLTPAECNKPPAHGLNSGSSQGGKGFFGLCTHARSELITLNLDWVVLTLRDRPRLGILEGGGGGYLAWEGRGEGKLPECWAVG